MQTYQIIRYTRSVKQIGKYKFLLLSSLLLAAAASADTLPYATDNGTIDRYDPVPYFTDGKAQRGSPEITVDWTGATWRFTSVEHRDAFVENPEKYAPQYGGYCAFGLAHGSDVPTNLKAWTIWEGKLNLKTIEEVTATWRYNPHKLIERADLKWAALNAPKNETE